MIRKIIILILSITLVLSFANISVAATGNKKVDWLVKEGLISGYPDGTYGLEKPITRAEVAAMVTRALKNEDTSDLLKTIRGKFGDVAVSHWANGYINYAANTGYVNGYPDNTFRPGNNITYAEIIKILVMVNGDIPDASGYQGSVWSAPYIIKAIETGIMNGVLIPESNYGLTATREKVFEMIYNTLMISYYENVENYTAVVIGNSRVSRLAYDEIALSIIEMTDAQNEREYAYKRGDSINLKIDKFKDSEDLLGKVVNFTLDKDGVVQDLVIDNSFDYYMGPALLSQNYLMTNTGEVFDVYTGARTDRLLEKLYAFYHNDKPYVYTDFINTFDEIDGEKDNSYISEFVRITIKNNVAYYIDSFDFSDISAVASVQDGGRTIFVYDDENNASTKKVVLKSVFGYYDGSFINLDKKDILAEDVIHIYGENAIVRMDAVYSGVYKGIDESSGVYYAYINRQYFQIRNSLYKKPVYSLDTNNFATLYDEDALYMLEDLESEKVIFTIDLNDSLQLISLFY